MAKSQQRTSKEAKKPKKDDGTSKPLSPGALSAPITPQICGRYSLGKIMSGPQISAAK